MRLRSPNQRSAITLAALIGLAVIGGFTTAEAGIIRQPPGATDAQPAATDVGAARKLRHARRPARSNADSMASQPPERPSFGYGFHDNSSYGGG
jgi:hypothetical protein